MKPAIYGVVLVAALSAAIASRHLPKAGLAPGAFRKVSDAEFAVVRGGMMQDAGYPRERYFEVSCDDPPVMLVDNSLEQLVIVMYAGREIDVSCVEPMLSHWSPRIVPD